MLVKEIGIANYKSFDSEGVKVSLVKRINIFIGKNNSGKSNFLRFVKLFSDYFGDWKKIPSTEIENQHMRNGQTPIFIFSLKLSEIWNKFSDQLGKEKIYTFKFIMPKFEIVGEHPLNEFSENFLVNLQNHYARAGKYELLKVITQNIISGINSDLEFFKKLIYIPHFREIDDTKEVAEKIFDGRKIISKLFEMQNPKIGDEASREKFEKIQNFVKDLLDEENLTIEVPHTRDRIIIEMNENRLSLESYGTGLHELVILCTALTIYDDYVFCIEEPELHLHPELQRKFIDYLQSFNNYFFISTHSNVFIDYKPNVNVFHVFKDGSATKIHSALTSQNSYEILNDLGYKASDILQSNGIIWVEGPSDRIYLRRWISLINDSLIEGIHYSIMYYGGRLLSHLTFDDENNELIKLLKINRNAVVLIDRDGISPRTKLNDTKKRIQQETSEGNCWITKGREIENYLSEDTIIQFLSNYGENLKFKNNPNKKLGENISSRNRNLKLKYESNKVQYAKEVVKYISEKDLMWLDLKKRMTHLITQIDKWNN